MAGGSVGIAIGCVLGMLPLLFIDGKKGNREESPQEICTALAKAATALLHAERCGAIFLFLFLVLFRYARTTQKTNVVRHTNQFILPNTHTHTAWWCTRWSARRGGR